MLNKMSDKLKRFFGPNFLSREAILKTLISYEKSLSSNYVMYHDSYRSYCNNEKTSNKRKLVHLFFWIVSVVHFFEYTIVYLSPNEPFVRTVGCPLIVLVPNDQFKLLYLTLVLISILIVMAKLLFTTLERNHRTHLFKLFHRWQTDPDLFGLNYTNTNKLIALSQLAFWAINVVRIFILTTMYICTIYFVSLGYIYHNFHLVNTTVHTTAFLIWLANSANFLCISVLAVFMPITMLNYKFDETLKTLRIAILWNNPNRIMSSISRHHQVTRLLNELGDMYSKIIGLIYFILPYIISLTLKPLFMPGFYIYLKIILILVFVIFVTFTYVLNYMVASITVRNEKAPKYIYPIFYNNSKISITTKLKIEAFLVRLNTEFIGIYCLDFFKFTKLSIYQYFISISSAYILISNLES